MKPGYKQTEVGVIPEDWESRPLRSIAPITTGSTPPTREPANYGEEFLFVSPVDMGRTKYISRTEKMLSRRGFSVSRPFPAGSVLFVCIGSTIGKCGIASETLTSNQQINAIQPSAGMSSEYIYYAVSAVAPRVKSLAAEQAVPIVNKTAFSDTPIPLPSTKAEQEAIAEALSDVDALIESLEQLLTKKRQLTQGAMQGLLTGKKRLPGFSAQWGPQRLGLEIEELEAGVSVNSVDEDVQGSAHDQCILKTSAVVNGFFLPHECKTIASRDLKRALLNPRVDTILISRMNTPDLVGECGYADRDYPNLFLPDRPWMTRFRHGTSVCVKWLSSVLSSAKVKVAIKAMATGTSGSMKNISKDAFLRLVIPFPEPEEQRAIAAVLGDMDAAIAALEMKLAKARGIKQGMMQELLTGRIRLV